MMNLPTLGPIARLSLLTSLLFTLAACTIYQDDGPDPQGKNQKVFICHKGKESRQVNEQAIRAHLDHGDSLGRCGS